METRFDRRSFPHITFNRLAKQNVCGARFLDSAGDFTIIGDHYGGPGHCDMKMKLAFVEREILTNE